MQQSVGIKRPKYFWLQHQIFYGALHNTFPSFYRQILSDYPREQCVKPKFLKWMFLLPDGEPYPCKVGKCEKLKEKVMKITSNEKVKLLVNYENKQKLTDKHFRKIIKFSNDKDVLVRSMVADLLINFESNESKKVLLKLACDKKAMVRTSAYDSLSAFKSKKVEKFLKKLY